jgi:hypothetical protein
MTLTNGVYEFPAQLTRMTGTHDSIFWFVQQEELNEMLLDGTNEKISDRFGTGLFYYNSSNGVQVVQKSGQMQLDATTEKLATAQLTPGCVTTSGNLKASCNLVCFDLVNGLLSDPTGQDARNVLVHHISVATIALLAALRLDGFLSLHPHRAVVLLAGLVELLRDVALGVVARAPVAMRPAVRTDKVDCGYGYHTHRGKCDKVANRTGSI